MTSLNPLIDCGTTLHGKPRGHRKHKRTSEQQRCPVCQKQHDRKTRSRPASYCWECHAAYMRRTRPKHSELTAEARKKANARSYANVYQRRGKILPMQCCKCGADAEKHHPDYEKPVEVVWLCRECHIKHHISDES